jgi:hypothetical protein
MGKMRWVALACFLSPLVLGSFGVDGSNARAEEEKCKLATKGDSIVAKACQKSYKEARKLMKHMCTVVNEGRAEKFECKTCHDKADDSGYDTLTKDGRDRFKGLVAEYEKKK